MVAPRQLVNQSLLDQTKDRSRGNQKNSPVKAYGERTPESRTGRGVWSWHFSPKVSGNSPGPARRTLLQVRVSPSTLCRPTIWNDHLSMKMHDRHNCRLSCPSRWPGHTSPNVATPCAKLQDMRGRKGREQFVGFGTPARASSELARASSESPRNLQGPRCPITGGIGHSKRGPTYGTGFFGLGGAFRFFCSRARERYTTFLPPSGASRVRLWSWLPQRDSSPGNLASRAIISSAAEGADFHS